MRRRAQAPGWRWRSRLAVMVLSALRAAPPSHWAARGGALVDGQLIETLVNAGGAHANVGAVDVDRDRERSPNVAHLVDVLVRRDKRRRLPDLHLGVVQGYQPAIAGSILPQA